MVTTFHHRSAEFSQSMKFFAILQEADTSADVSLEPFDGDLTDEDSKEEDSGVYLQGAQMGLTSIQLRFEV